MKALASGDSQLRGLKALPVPTEDHDPAHNTLEFGTLIGGCPEILAVHGMFGIQLFCYDHRKRRYLEQPAQRLWKVALSECRTPERTEAQAWPGGWRLARYLEAGLDSLGYPAALCRQPKLAEFLDNPGLLALLVANESLLGELLSQTGDRVALLRSLSGHGYLSGRHLRWLKKVRPGRQAPTILARNLMQSLLQVPAFPIIGPGASRNRQFSKLFAHQRQWLPGGIEFARSLVRQQAANPERLDWLLCGYNGHPHPEISLARKILAAVRAMPALPDIIRERISYCLRGPHALSLDFARVITGLAGKHGCQDNSVAICLLFVHDHDLPTPVIAGNGQVQALATLAAIRAHARTAKNCLWTLEMLEPVMARRLDLYSLQGQTVYTFSIDRQTLDIRDLETTRGTAIAPSDLGTIADWHRQGTRLPR